MFKKLSLLLKSLFRRNLCTNEHLVSTFFDDLGHIAYSSDKGTGNGL